MLTRQQALKLEAEIIGSFRELTGVPLRGISLTQMSDGGFGFDLTIWENPSQELPKVIAGAPIRYRPFVQQPYLLSSQPRRRGVAG